MERINGVELPRGYNGIGLHDSPGAWAANMSYHEAERHAQDELWRHGVTAYKLFTDGLKVERARAYVDCGILTMVRFWEGVPTWGRPPQEWVTEAEKIRLFVDVGVQLFELGGNEFNIADEWGGQIPDAKGIAKAVVEVWEVMLERAAQAPGCIPMFPSNTPGGHVDHRVSYREIIAALGRKGLLATIKHVAIHPRPFNNPPDAVWTERNTVTFDEWRWIRDQFRAAGVEAYYWATEHGYSLGDSQNAEHLPIDLAKWGAYNWELFRRLDPAPAGFIEPELAGVFYWFHAGYGHWGPWPKDALLDSPDPRMPAPSPLWLQMEREKWALDFWRQPSIPSHTPDSSPQPEPPIQEVTQEWPIRPMFDELETHPEKVYSKRPLHKAEMAVIHHSAGRQEPANVEHHIKAIARYHVRTKDWPGIAYHFIITADGAIYKTNRLATVSFHACGGNYRGIGICLLGRFDHDHGKPTQAQLAACRWLIRERLKTVKEVRLHKDITATACPGRRKWVEGVVGCLE